MNPIEIDAAIAAKRDRYGKQYNTAIWSTLALGVAIAVAAFGAVVVGRGGNAEIALLGFAGLLLPFIPMVALFRKGERIEAEILSTYLADWGEKVESVYGLGLTGDQIAGLIPPAGQPGGKMVAPRTVATIGLDERIVDGVLIQDQLGMIWTGKEYALFQTDRDGRFVELPRKEAARGEELELAHQIGDED